MPLMILLSIFSLTLINCASVPRPDAWICGVNATGMKLRCYNTKFDYSDDGTLKPEAKPTEYPLKSVNDLNAWVCMDPLSLGKFKVYLGDLRDFAREHCR